MPAPTTTEAATDALVALGPWGAADDDATGWALLRWLDAMLGTGQLQDVNDWARDSDAGDPGWSAWMDPNSVPFFALGWLGQFVGVPLLVGLAEPAQRARVSGTAGFQRGTLAAIAGAARQYLTGGQRVDIYERFGGDAYALKVVTYLVDTPDPTAVLNGILAQKPAGIVLTYSTQAGPSWEQMSDWEGLGAVTWGGMGTTTWADRSTEEPVIP